MPKKQNETSLTLLRLEFYLEDVPIKWSENLCLNLAARFYCNPKVSSSKDNPRLQHVRFTVEPRRKKELIKFLETFCENRHIAFKKPTDL